MGDTRSILFLPPAGSDLLTPGLCGYQPPTVYTLGSPAPYRRWVEGVPPDSGMCGLGCRCGLGYTCTLPLLWHGAPVYPAIDALVRAVGRVESRRISGAIAAAGVPVESPDGLLIMARRAVVVLGGGVEEVTHA